MNIFFTPSSKRFVLAFAIMLISLLQINHASAQIAQRGSATTATGNKTITINVPTGVVAGDIMIANISEYYNGTNVSATSNGWTELSGSDLGNQGRGTILYRIANSSEPASYTFSATDNAATKTAGAIVAFSGVDENSPFDLITSSSLVTSADQAVTSLSTISGVTTVSSNAAVILFGMSSRGTTQTNANFSSWAFATSPSPISELYDIGWNGVAGAAVGAAWALKTTAGATGNGSFSVVSSRTGGQVVILKPKVLRITAGSASHGLSCVGTSKEKTTYTITNCTTSDITGLTVTSNSAEFVVSNAPTSIEASGTATYDVTFTPSAAGARSATITIASTSPVNSITSSLTGTGSVVSVSFTAEPGAGACINTDLTYTTQAGQSNYTWTLPGVLNTDYSITSGGTGSSSNIVTLKWLTTGSKTLTLNYTDASGCQAAAAVSSVATTINAVSVAGSVSGSATVCSSSTTPITLSGNAGTIQWQSSSNNSTYNNVATATSANYNVVNPSATTYYRAVVTNGYCPSVNTSDYATITVVAGTTGSWLGLTNTDWATSSNWCGGVPSASAATIQSGTAFQPIITGIASVSTLSISSGATLQLNTGGALTTTGLLTNNGTFTINAGTSTIKGITNAGTVNMNGGTVHATANITLNSANSILNQTDGTIWMAANLSTTPSTHLVISAGTVNQSGGVFGTDDYSATGGSFNQNGANALLRIYHDWKVTSAHIFSATNGTTRFSGSGGGASTYIGTNTQFHHVIIDAGVDPKFSNDANSIIKVSGDFSNNNTTLANTTNSTFNFNGNGNQSITGTSSSAMFGHFVVNKSSGTLSLANAISTSGDLSVQAGTFTNAGFAITLAATKSLSVSNGATLILSGITSMPTVTGTKTFGATSTVNYSGTAQTVTSETYGHLNLSGSGTKTMPSSNTTVAGNLTTDGSISATALDTINVSGNVTISSGTTFSAGAFTHAVGGNWVNNGTFTASTSKINFNGTSTMSGSSTTSFNNLAIAASSSLTSSTGNVNISGNFTNDGTFNHNNGTLTLTEGGGNNFEGNNQIDLNNLTVNLSGQGATTFNKLVTVSGVLTFTNGRLNMNNGTNLEVTNTGTVTGASQSSYVWGGKMKKTGLESAFTFPIGHSVGATRIFNPLTIEVSGGGSTDVYVAGYNHGTPSKTTKRNDLDDIPRRGNWTLQRTAGTDKSLTLTAYSGTGYQEDSQTFTTLGYNTFARSFSDGWGKAVSSNATMSTSGSVQTMRVTGILLGTSSGSYNKQTTDYSGLSTGMNNIVSGSESNAMLFGSPSDPIDVGPSSSSGGASTLPVQLINFTAKVTPEKKSALSWTTATESVNKGFRIERQTTDLGSKFEHIGFVYSKATGGNSQTNLYYNFLDNNPKTSAANHYRLVQEDLDGKLTYSEVRMIRLGGQSVTMVFPNPSAGNVTISRTADDKKMNIQIIDLSGKVVKEYNNISESYYKFNITQPGVYNIKMTYPETGEQSVQRVVVQR
jgi:hypothetical protein